MIGGPRQRPSSRAVLLTGLAIDSCGTGMFLPIALLYLVRVVGLSMTAAGLVTAAATVVSLAVPAVVGLVVDRIGARAVLIAAFAAQAAGMTLQLFADRAVTAFAAVLCATIGQRAFWSSVFTLLAQLAGDAAKEPTFALAGSLQAMGFAAGSATGSALIGIGSTGAFRAIIAVNAASFVVGILLLLFGVRSPHRPAAAAGTGIGYRVVLADRRFLIVLAAYCALPLGANAATLTVPVFLVQQLAMPTWVPGLVGFFVTVCTSTLRNPAVRRVRNWNRIKTLRAAAVSVLVYFLGMAALVAVPPAWRLPVLPVFIVPYIVGQLVHVSVGNALVEAMAPAGAKGRYLAVSQYCWGLTSVAVAASVSLFQVSRALPWILSAAAAAGSIALFGRLADRLPAEVLYRPDAVLQTT